MKRVVKVALNAFWWRHERYEIVGGAIRPVPGTAVERYSLFEELQKEKSRPGRPHITFGNLNMQEPRALLDWVSRWGLLGLLPHSLLYAEYQNGVTHYPAPGGWRTGIALGTNIADYEEFQQMMAGGLPPGRIVRRRGHLVEMTSADAALPTYFPTLPATGYPLPLSDRFWDSYQEPVSEWASEIVRLRNTLDGYARLSTVPAEAELARHTLFGQADLRVNTPFNTGAGQRVMELAAPTLLSALYALVWMDWGEGAWVRVCPRCGKLYPSTRMDKEYCGPTCKHAAEVSRWRARKEGGGEAE